MAYMTEIDQTISQIPVYGGVPSIRILYFYGQDYQIIRRALEEGKRLWALIRNLPGIHMPEDCAPDNPRRMQALRKCGAMMDLSAYYAQPDKRAKQTPSHARLHSARKDLFAPYAQPHKRAKRVPSCLYLTDFHVYAEKKKADSYIKTFLDDPNLENSILLISSPYMHIPQGFESRIKLITVPQIDHEDIANLILKTADQVSITQRDAVFKAAKQYVGLSHEHVETILFNLRAEFGITCEAFADSSNPALRENCGKKTRELIDLAKLEMNSKQPAYSLIDINDCARAMGMDQYEDWLMENAQSFKDNDPDAPRAIGFVGVSGTGKSLMAKRTAMEFGCQQLVEFDLGAVKAKEVGESNKNLRQCLKEFEDIEPRVVLIDEAEKYLTYNSQSHEVSKELIGTLLKWMQNKKKRVFLYFTCNDITQLAPEMFRPERVDAVFFVGMPWGTELGRILQANLLRMDASWKDKGKSGLLADDLIERLQECERKNEADPYCMDIVESFALAAESTKRDLLFTGADLSQLIKDANKSLRRQGKTLPFDADAFRDAMLHLVNTTFRSTGERDMDGIVNLYKLCAIKNYRPVSSHEELENIARSKNLTALPKRSYDLAYDRLLYTRIGTKLLSK